MLSTQCWRHKHNLLCRQQGEGVCVCVCTVHWCERWFSGVNACQQICMRALQNYVPKTADKYLYCISLSEFYFSILLNISLSSAPNSAATLRTVPLDEIQNASVNCIMMYVLRRDGLMGWNAALRFTDGDSELFSTHVWNRAITSVHDEVQHCRCIGCKTELMELMEPAPIRLSSTCARIRN